MFQSYKPYCIEDFYAANAWLIFRMDICLHEQPVDIYIIMNLPDGEVIASETIETTISQIQAEELIQEARKKFSSFPSRIILTKGDPAEPYFSKLAAELGIDFETTPTMYLDELTAPLKLAFGEHFCSTAALSCSRPNDDIDASDAEAARCMIPDSYDLCPCASGKKYKFCCKKIFREITEAMADAEAGNISEALNWIEKAKSIVGETAEVLCREAIVYSYMNDRQKSDAILDKCLLVNSKHPRAHYVRAIALKGDGDIIGAIKYYETAIANYPPSDHFHLNEVYNNLGSAFYGIGDIDKAKASWEIALLHLPSDNMVRKNLEEFIYKRPIG